jgi:2-polyprenyl-3-methyl-5-hydroxy-6-metoxy-1,4-benzoquinol methylase
MTTILEHAEATVHIERLDGERSKISVIPKVGVFVPTKTWETSYPLGLIEHIFRTKGPVDLCDEIKRDEDPAFVEHIFRWSILSYVRPQSFSGKRVLDFGCGCGASSLVLARLLPVSTQIVGVDLSSDYINLARHRSQIFGLDERLSFHVSPESDSLPNGIGKFDYVVLSAVYEHLLPQERLTLLPLLWSHTKPGPRSGVRQSLFAKGRPGRVLGGTSSKGNPWRIAEGNFTIPGARRK